MNIILWMPRSISHQLCLQCLMDFEWNVPTSFAITMSCAAYTLGELRNGEGQITQAWVTTTKTTSKTCIVLTLKKIKHGDAKFNFHKPHMLNVDEPPRKHPVHQRMLRTSSTKSSVVTFRRAPCRFKKRWGASTVEVAVRYKQDKRTPLRLLVSTSTLILHKTRSKCKKEHLSPSKSDRHLDEPVPALELKQQCGTFTHPSFTISWLPLFQGNVRCMAPSHHNNGNHHIALNFPKVHGNP